MDIFYIMCFFNVIRRNLTVIKEANKKDIKTREDFFWLTVTHTCTHRHLQTHKGRHYLEAMDHVNGILSTLWECGRCFSAWLRRLSSGTVCITNSIYSISSSEMEMGGWRGWIVLFEWTACFCALWEMKQKLSLFSF